MSPLPLYVNDAYLPYLTCSQRTQIFYGGASSGKSYFLAQRAVMENLQGANYLVCRNIAKTLRHSSFNEIVKKIDDMGVRHLYAINRSDMAITCLANQKQILFAGLDNVEKLKSITPVQGVIEKIWIEEATEVDRAAYKQLTKRLRGRTDRPKGMVLSFNPIVKEHWIYKEFFARVWDDDRTRYQDGALCIVKTTYRDNLFLSDEDRRALQTETDPYFRAVYTEGNWGVLGNVVFRNWRVEDLSGQIPSFSNLYNGMDFGFSNDPTVLIRAHYDGARKRVYVFDEYYKAGMYNDETARVCKERIGNQYVICDSQDSRSIAELNRYGVRALPAAKGPDSILHGIQWLQQHEIIIDVRCQHFQNEMQTYKWCEDKYGNALQRPVDQNNHGIDALRYATEPLQVRTEARAARRI